MTYELTVVAGDMFPDVEPTVLDENNAAVDVSGASVEFSLRDSRDPDNVVVDGNDGVVVNGPAGRIAYRWASGDTDQPSGTYEGKFRIVPAVGDPFWFPTQGFLPIYIEERPGA